MHITATQRQGIPYYHCDGFGHGVSHGFSTRLGGVSLGPCQSLNLGATLGDCPAHVAENFRRFCGAVGCDPHRLVKNHQVHGACVRTVTPDDAVTDLAHPGTVPADGLVTNVVGLTLAVFSADCIPILMYDPLRRVVGAVHGGWRGTASGIAAVAVETMVRQYGTRPQDIRVAIGPGISPCHFLTHDEVPQAMVSTLGDGARPHLRPHGNGQQYHVDLKQLNALWLRRSGVLPQHIALDSPCTACHLDHFWSHRIQGLTRGSMAALISLTDSP